MKMYVATVVRKKDTNDVNGEALVAYQFHMRENKEEAVKAALEAKTWAEKVYKLPYFVIVAEYTEMTQPPTPAVEGLIPFNL